MTASPPGGAGRGHDARNEFYVGYLDETPRGLARFTRRTAIGLVLLGAGLGAGLALRLERFDEGIFEFGIVEEHDGELLVDPHPRLVTAGGPAEGYLLVAEGKHGIDAGVAASPPWANDGSHTNDGGAAAAQTVSLAGTLIENPEAAMLEVHAIELPGAPAAAPATTGQATTGPGSRGRAAPFGLLVAGETPTSQQTAGRLEARADAATAAAPVHTLVGEIVDTKCYLGAMKPGRGKPHRGCASLCIRGGIPAALLVRTEDTRRDLVHLVDTSGQPLGQELLSWVGEPVAVAGQLRRADARLFLAVHAIGPAGAGS